MRVLVVFVVIGVAAFLWLRADDAPEKADVEAAPAAEAEVASVDEAAPATGFRLVKANWDLKDRSPVYIPPRQRVLLDEEGKERAADAGEAFGTGSVLDSGADRSVTGGSAVVNVNEDDPTVLELE